MNDQLLRVKDELLGSQTTRSSMIAGRLPPELIAAIIETAYHSPMAPGAILDFIRSIALVSKDWLYLMVRTMTRDLRFPCTQYPVYYQRLWDCGRPASTREPSPWDNGRKIQPSLYDLEMLSPAWNGLPEAKDFCCSVNIQIDWKPNAAAENNNHAPGPSTDATAVASTLYQRKPENVTSSLLEAFRAIPYQTRLEKLTLEYFLVHSERASEPQVVKSVDWHPDYIYTADVIQLELECIFPAGTRTSVITEFDMAKREPASASGWSYYITSEYLSVVDPTKSYFAHSDEEQAVKRLSAIEEDARDESIVAVILDECPHLANAYIDAHWWNPPGQRDRSKFSARVLSSSRKVPTQCVLGHGPLVFHPDVYPDWNSQDVQDDNGRLKRQQRVRGKALAVVLEVGYEGEFYGSKRDPSGRKAETMDLTDAILDIHVLANYFIEL